MKINRKLLFFPALAVGVIAVILAVQLKPSLPIKPAQSRARIVDTLALQKQPMAPVAIGFGKVSPQLEWKAIAEVSGKVIYRHPRLNKGAILHAGTEILRIDPLDYELKLAQAEADLKSSETSLARVKQEQQNLQQTLKIEKNRLEIARKEAERKQNLRSRGLTSQSDVDQQQQAALQQQKLVQEIENQLLLIPGETRVAEAKVKVNAAKVQEAERLLAKTRIVLPDDLRIASVDAELNQVVNLQQVMVTGHGMRTMEVEAQLSIHDLQTLALSLVDFGRDETGMPQVDLTFIHASIELNSGDLTASWPAKVARVSETVDPNQATAGVILEIAQDYRDLTPETSPPLVNGMFVKARIEGNPTPSWVIPERALHGQSIYLMDEQNRLRIQPVEVRYRRDEQVVIDGDLQSGDRVILNDLLPAIEGMLLRDSRSESQESAS
ncbi:efflux RND transporter periplasmic adaptor subunit [Vibrio sp.]|uniref:efflux RND transporter periplasmic adaptor subunit n=1 Tax=Vibrio sp. TaxID=678 RepID=UPI003D1185EB